MFFYIKFAEKNPNVVKTVGAKSKILFLINPKSGVQSKKRVPEMIEKFIDRDRYDFTIKKTMYAGHACELAAEAVKEGYDIVVAVGGDGTINEVGRSLVHTPTALAVIPCGSGNGFARHLGIPLEIKSAIKFINKAESTPIDYGRLNGHAFFCACGVGFDARVSNDFAKGGRRGMFSYVQKTLLDWLTYKPEVYEVEADGFKKSMKAFVIACGNASQYGNNAYITPYASMHDGKLSVSVLAPFTPIEVPLIVTQLFGNMLDRNSKMFTFGTKGLKIRRQSSGPVHYDGEPCEMAADLNIEIIESGLNVMATPGWDGKCAPVPIYKQFYEIMAGTVR